VCLEVRSAVDLAFARRKPPAHPSLPPAPAQAQDGRPSCTTMCSQEELGLLRAMLRRNARRMLPSAWQRRHVPLGPDSPWMATYIAPIYPDWYGEPSQPEPSSSSNSSSGTGAGSRAGAGPGGSSSSGPVVAGRQGSSGEGGGGSAAAGAARAAASAAAGGARRCALCSKEGGGLKRCKGCNSVRYCGADCQKEHWKAHKAACKAAAKLAGC
jgi:hypothetical protein